MIGWTCKSDEKRRNTSSIGAGTHGEEATWEHGDEENGLGPNAMMNFGNSDVETVGSTVTQPFS
jgi:hypothetical protein